jgi:hypothetical protein
MGSITSVEIEENPRPLKWCSGAQNHLGFKNVKGTGCSKYVISVKDMILTPANTLIPYNPYGQILINFIHPRHVKGVPIIFPRKNG